jgi:hypothetical protein
MLLVAAAVLLLLLVVLLRHIVLIDLHNILMLLLVIGQLLQRVSGAKVTLQRLQLGSTCAPAVSCSCSHIYGYGSIKLSRGATTPLQ